MKINRYSRYKIIEKKIVMRIIYTYDFKDYKTLTEKSFFFFKNKIFNEETQKQINYYR